MSSSIISVHSTTSLTPLYYLKNIHYASLTDISWYEPNSFAISSMDGFVSFVTIELTKMGSPVIKEKKEEDSMLVSMNGDHKAVA